MQQSGKPRVLVVDDEPTFLVQTTECLLKHGYEVVSARNGKDALVLADEGNIDLILLDIIMPVLNGVEVTKILKRNPQTKGIPIIVVSSMTEYKERVEFFRIGANDYMPKPIDDGELIARVELQLQVVHLRKEVEKTNDILRQKNRMLEQHVSRIEHDLAVARKLQRSLQPKNDQIMGNISVCFEHMSSENLGSDYIDFLIDQSGIFHVILSDVSGHGIPSALLAAQLKMLFSTTVHRGLPAGEMMIQLNNMSVDLLIEGYYFTAIYMQYNPETNDLAVVNAGHIPLLYFERASGKIKMVESTNTPLGFLANEKYSEFHFKPGIGDVAVLLTDGLTEHRNAANEMFEIKGAIDVLKRNAFSEPRTIIEAMLKAARDFSDVPVFKDDLTVSVLKFISMPDQEDAG